MVALDKAAKDHGAEVRVAIRRSAVWPWDSIFYCEISCQFTSYFALNMFSFSSHPFSVNEHLSTIRITAKHTTIPETWPLKFLLPHRPPSERVRRQPSTFLPASRSHHKMGVSGTCPCRMLYSLRHLWVCWKTSLAPSLVPASI